MGVPRPRLPQFLPRPFVARPDEAIPNPDPTLSFPFHSLSGPSRVIPFDLSHCIGTDYLATSPNLLAAYIRVCKGEKVESKACATSQVRKAGLPDSNS